jgi:hypothetical protein
LFDVTGDLYPLSPEQYHRAVSERIEDPEYGPVLVQDGYIVLQRNAGRERVSAALAMLDVWGPLSGE